MNEQEYAALFSEQIDRMLAGESPEAIPAIDDLPELLEVGQQISHTQFQAGSAAQSAFQSSLTNWFGTMNGASSMTILGLSKTWFISIIIAILVVVTGTGFIALIATSVFIFSADDSPVVSTDEPTGTAVAGEPDDDDDDDDGLQPTAAFTSTATFTPTATLVITPSITGTSTVTATPGMTGTPTTTSTAVATTTPASSATPKPSGTPGNSGGLPPIVIINHFPNVDLCEGAYVAQTMLVNYGSAPVTNAALVWEVIEGAEFVDDVRVLSEYLVLSDTEPNNEAPPATPAPAYFADLEQISIDQEIDLDINVDVGDSWWEQPDGTLIKVRVSIENSIEIANAEDYWDHDRGHGNDPDGYDEDNPGRGHRRGNDDDDDDDDDDDGDFSTHSQVITIVKQGAEWVTLEGFIHEYGDQTYLIDGNLIIVNECTGLPVKFIPGSKVKVIGWLQPNGSFVAVNIIVVNVNIITGDFDSGKPYPSSDSGDDDDDDDGGGKGNGKGKGGRGGGGDNDDDDDD